MTNPGLYSLCNPNEYYADPVTKAEQVSFAMPEGRQLKAMLESLDIAALEGTDFIPGRSNRYRVPKESGVYFVFVDGKLSYIGQTCSLARRIRGNHNFITPLKEQGKPFTVRWLLLPRNQRLKAETFLCRKLLPSNRQQLIGETA